MATWSPAATFKRALARIGITISVTRTKAPSYSDTLPVSRAELDARTRGIPVLTPDALPGVDPAYFEVPTIVPPPPSLATLAEPNFEEVLNDVMAANDSEDPLQGFDAMIDLAGRQVTEFQIDYHQKQLYLCWGMTPSDLEHLATGEIPVPESIAITFPAGEFDDPTGQRKGVRLTTDGVAKIHNVAVEAGRKVVTIEALVEVIDMEPIDAWVVDAAPAD